MHESAAAGASLGSLPVGLTTTDLDQAMKQSSTVVITIRNKLGLHARPAMMFVDTAKKWPCDIRVRRVDQDEIVDGKSIMFMMMLAATKGAQIEICACGEQAEEACKALKALVESGFDEE